MNLLAVTSIHWIEKVYSLIIPQSGFLFYHHHRRNMLNFAQTFMQSRKANRQSTAGDVNLVFSFAAE